MATDNDASERGWADPAREEFMLKIQASILERVLRKGKASTARRCLEDSSRSEFDAVDHEEFLRWLAASPRSATNTPRQEHALLPVTSRKRTGEDSDGFHVFSVTPPVRSSGTSPSRTKRCDGSDPCSHCPTQGFDSESDFWKVLGCFRGHLRDMVDIFCPDFSRATTRKFKQPMSGIETINFVLTRSRVSLQKKQRIMHLIKTRSEFAMLLSSTWENTSIRESISHSAISLDQYEMDELLIDAILVDYEALWAVLQLVSMDRTYLMKTAYNLFSLIRVGNYCSQNDRTRWDIFFQAKRILRQSVELYLLERLCGQIATGQVVGPMPFDTRGAPNTLVMVDLKEDVEFFLRSFEKICAGRAKLTGSSQLAAFFALLVFSIAKSILTDAYVIRDSYEEVSPWTVDHALTISSAYKGLVSVFCWSSKSDAMLQYEGDDPVATAALEQIHGMVRLKSWAALGFRGTKDFLLSLGTCSLPDGSFNGFLAQKFGIDTISKMPTRVGGDIHEDAGTIDTRREIFGMLPGGLRDSFVRNFGGVLLYPVDSAPEEQGTLPNRPPSAADAGPHQQRMAFNLPSDGYNANPISTTTSGGYSSITFVPHDSDEEQVARRHGGRRGALDSETLEKSREVRKLGACWNCWVLKVPCSEGFRCERCQNKVVTGSHTYRFCNRGTFSSVFMSFLFPDFMFDQYRLQNVATLTDNWVSEWVTDSMEVVIRWVGSEIEMTVPVSQFRPSDAAPELKLYHGLDGQWLAAESLPFALRRGTSDVHVVTNSYSEKLNFLVRDSDFPVHNANLRSSELVQIVLAAVQPFYEQSQDHPLIRYSLLLCLALRFAARPSLFSTSSAQSGHILKFVTEPEKVYTSRLFNHQTKGIFYRLAMMYAEELFALLEKLMRSRDRSTWPVCFATMLVLCVCLERLQMLAVVQTAFARSGNQEVASNEEPRKSCQATEDIPFGQLTHIFHAIYRTHKNEQHSFNPFVRGWVSGGIPPFEGAAMTMVSEIKQKVFENCMFPFYPFEPLTQLKASAPLLSKHNKPLNVEVSLDVFGRENSGRLVAKFLLSFITWSEKNEAEAGPLFPGNLDLCVQGNSEQIPSMGEGGNNIFGR
ncbi:uncharacterized protein PAC_06666 [Phialocephala subalpina]|uniref:Uncharacterized protein n=1 Tax=Phialocephala subalpina TaxID=576137 RepID=A0A1L7WVI4_9HELO|nr:uncharacterized protein PAC_06666 [Phialocephala subalpina]